MSAIKQIINSAGARPMHVGVAARIKMMSERPGGCACMKLARRLVVTSVHQCAIFGMSGGSASIAHRGRLRKHREIAQCALLSAGRSPSSTAQTPPSNLGARAAAWSSRGYHRALERRHRACYGGGPTPPRACCNHGVWRDNHSSSALKMTPRGIAETPPAILCVLFMWACGE